MLLLLYPQPSDLSRKDGKENVGGKQRTVGGWGRRGGVEDPARNEEMLLSAFPGLSIALSLLIRKLMQLSVLIPESSF